MQALPLTCAWQCLGVSRDQRKVVASKRYARAEEEDHFVDGFEYPLREQIHRYVDTQVGAC
jgi:hypothetical protein